MMIVTTYISADFIKVYMKERISSEETIAIKFSLLPPTQNKMRILLKMSSQFKLLYNITAKRLKSFNNVEQVSARHALDELRKELNSATDLQNKIAEEAIKYARSNYQTIKTNDKKYKESVGLKIERLLKQKEAAKKPSKIADLEKKIDKWKRRLNAEITLPELKADIIRIHNQTWGFQEHKGTYYIVFPGEKIGNNRYSKVWLPIKPEASFGELINRMKFGVGQVNLKNNTFTTTITVPISKQRKYTPEISIGIDRGINNIAVLVALDKDGKLVASNFFNGDEARHTRNRFNKYRKQVSQVGRVDLVKKSKGRESNWMEYTNHNVSREIVDMASKLNNSIIKLEKLNNFAPHLKWTFFQLQQMIEYKAKMEGIPVAYVNPAYTSKTCPKCGNISHQNRNGIHFECVECHYINNADFVGAWNIAKRKIKECK